MKDVDIQQTCVRPPFGIENQDIPALDVTDRLLGGMTLIRYILMPVCEKRRD